MSLKITEVNRLKAEGEIPLNPPFKKVERRDGSHRVAKTGLAKLMREWMATRTGTRAQQRFTIQQMCEGLNVMPGAKHQVVINALNDFVRRGEVTFRVSAKYNRRVFYYVQDWHKELKGKINRKVFKAMYVSQTFAVTDLCRLTGIKERNWFDKLINQLKKTGHITQVQRRLCAHGAGAENVYHITNRDKFKIELLR